MKTIEATVDIGVDKRLVLQLPDNVLPGQHRVIVVIEDQSESGSQDYLQGIEKTTDVCGGDARVAGTRIPVWVLVDARAKGYSDADLLASYPTLSAQHLVSAWLYAEMFEEEVRAAITRNEAA